MYQFDITQEIHNIILGMSNNFVITYNLCFPMTDADFPLGFVGSCL